MSRNLEQGIEAVQKGNKEEGARLIRIALKDELLPSNLRAVGLLWLAETKDDPKFKIECYRLANQADPTNQDVSSRLSYWMSRELPEQKSGGTGSGQAHNPQSGGTGQIPAQNPGQGGGIQPDYGSYQQGANSQQPPQTGTLNPQYGQYTGGQNPQQIPGTGQLNPNYGQQVQPQNPLWQANSGNTSGMYPAVQGQNPQQVPGTGQLNPNYGQQIQPQNPLWQANTGNTSGMYPAVQGQNPQQVPGTGQLNPNYGQQSTLSDTGSYGKMPAIYLQQVQRSVGILDGPNGKGTGFFVTRNGLIATTRYIVGGEQIVKIELADKRVIDGTVVRSFPQYDLAFIQVNVQLDHLLSVHQSLHLTDNTPIIAVTHTGHGLRSTKRATRHETAPYWFPTLINHLRDAGGNPIFTEQDNLLVGMLTKDASRSNGYMYGLHISRIYQCVEQYHQELAQITGNVAYCPACGIISRAPGFGGNYCEHCGNTLPFAIDRTRFPQTHLISLYGETNHHPCPNCASQAGFYQKACLRCGYEL